LSLKASLLHLQPTFKGDLSPYLMARGEGGLLNQLPWVGGTPCHWNVLPASLSCVWWMLQPQSIGQTQRCRTGKTTRKEKP